MAAILLALVPDANTRVALRDALDARYGAAYEVAVAEEHGDALALLSAAAEVALVIAPMRNGGVDFMIDARRLHPAARRLFMIDVGDAELTAELGQALTLNHADAYFGQPWATPEEELYPIVGEALRRWAREQQPRYEKAIIVDEPDSARGRHLHTWLERNTVVTAFHPTNSPRGQELLAGPMADAAALPAVLLWDGRVLSDPEDDELAEALSAHTSPRRTNYDVAIVGAGPAGLAAGVYSGSEGLQAVIVEADAIGGQAGTSAKIRNYLGFPWGISGGELTELAARQTQQLGTEMVVARAVTRLERGTDAYRLTLSNNEVITARAVVLAGGVTYNRLGIDSVDALVGAGVFYGAAASEVKTMGDLDVLVVGAGNSAGQAAAHLASAGARVTVLVRGDSLAKSMSDYLVREIGAAPNITVRCNTEILAAIGDQRLEFVEVCDKADGSTNALAADALFIFIGARPHTAWLEDTVELDDRGFILTGEDVGGRPLETSWPGVFAVGDIRHGSVKRVAAAVGEGSTAAMMVREYLGRL
jgi:thioredoxin reductase (NADPH)